MKPIGSRVLIIFLNCPIPKLNHIVHMNSMCLYNTVSNIYAICYLHFVEFSFCSHMFSTYKFEYIYCWYQFFSIFLWLNWNIWSEKYLSPNIEIRQKCPSPIRCNKSIKHATRQPKRSERAVQNCKTYDSKHFTSKWNPKTTLLPSCF